MLVTDEEEDLAIKAMVDEVGRLCAAKEAIAKEPPGKDRYDRIERLEGHVDELVLKLRELLNNLAALKQAS